ncbi:receptor-like protein eix1 [Quercus suber]|uniref:Receptor-like protein eix1 n=1 Tax=Quercus suber TaxID=58331 RepID=A0AAW0M3D1_QUESU
MGGSSLQLLLTFFLFLLCMKPTLGNYWGVGDANLGCKEHERQALVKIKEDLIDDYGYLSSWSTRVGREDYCKWKGVNWNNQIGHLGNLSSLQYLDLAWNNFNEPENLEWLRPLSSLSFLGMSSVNLSKINN